MPQLGETVTEGTITRWFKQVGDTVARDEVLFEVSTDKVDTEVPSPFSGTLAEIRVSEGETVDVGTILAVLSDGAAPVAEPSPAPVAEPEPVMVEPEPVVARPAAAATGFVPDSVPDTPSVTTLSPAPPSAQSTATQGHGKVLSPVVRRLIGEFGIDPNNITGTGLGGRISRDDVQRFIEANQLVPDLEGAGPEPVPVAQEPPAPAPVPPPTSVSAPQAVPDTPAPAPTPAPVPAPSLVPAPTTASAPLVQAGTRDAVVPLSNIRRKTGEHMVMSKGLAPHTLTAIEVDYENVESVRRSEGASFKEQEGFSLTYLPFIARATIDALREYPHLNASVGERELVVHNYVNLAIAVDLDFQGLLAPVVCDADGKRMRSIARDIVDLAGRARAKQLAPDELSGGTFTMTNAGSYGTMMQFPIINQPQVAILSTDGVKRKPVVIEDDYGNESIAIHSVGVLAMAWDHRAIDGAYAAAFLARTKEIIETRDWDAELA
ncbi:MAG: 2-oxo acid dehydrogenase subunit E2 [Actinomycetia bacterium]|nr:2-oxo acid dehydrogenase subunit E2 [Actinomycetes bacterium]MCP5032591.1 2-oxo acid dehydrogenase subunit E2 [Actinomycetes bacterium]